MRVPLQKLLESLGVGQTLSPYETRPWFLYDEAKKSTCSAEVRMGPDYEDVEAEIQVLKDEEEGGEGSGEGGGTMVAGGGPEQIMRLRALPISEGQWSTVYLVVKGKDYKNEVHDWETKGCNFFRACVEALQMQVMPDFDALIEKELDDGDGFGGGKRGRIGRKSPKIKPAAMMGMNKRGM